MILIKKSQKQSSIYCLNESSPQPLSQKNRIKLTSDITFLRKFNHHSTRKQDSNKDKTMVLNDNIAKAATIVVLPEKSTPNSYRASLK